MPSLIQRMRIHDAVYWATNGTDFYGKPTYADPVAIRCRWENEARERRFPDGYTFFCRAVVYVDRPVVLKGLLRFGKIETLTDLVNPFGNSDTFEIKVAKDTPNRHGTETLRKAYL